MFKLISDTSCDWIKEYAEEHNVTLVPLYTTFDGQTYYKEQFEISYDEFYRKMTDENAFPKSSLPSIQDYVDAFMPSVGSWCTYYMLLYNNIFLWFIQLSLHCKGYDY